MMMFKTKSVRLVEALANHPEIRPTLEYGDHRIDATFFVNDPDNLIYANDKGLILLHPVVGGAYRAHVGFLKSGRGKHALACCRQVLNDLFTQKDISTVVAGIPLPLHAARLFCKMLGFVHECQDAEQEWMTYRRT